MLVDNDWYERLNWCLKNFEMIGWIFFVVFLYWGTDDQHPPKY